MGWSKYKNVRTKIDGYNFSSRLEANTYLLLKEDPDIEITHCQIQIYLTDAKILYKPDFRIRYKKTDEEAYVEAKGFQTASWRIKRRLWKFYGPAPLLIYMGKGSGLFLAETIVPKLLA